MKNKLHKENRNKMIEFDLSGAIEAQKVINDCYMQALEGLYLSRGNIERTQYWFSRILHLIGELNDIDELIYEIEAVAEQAKPPLPNNYNETLYG